MTWRKLLVVKGAQKQMVVVKTNDSEVFEEAYFVVRRGACAKRMDMISEANKIVEGVGANRGRRREKIIKMLMYSLLSFLSGGAFGAATVAILVLVSQMGG